MTLFGTGVQAFAVVLLAQTGIMVGVFFISGQLLPQTLAAVYARLPSDITRTLVASALVFPLANWMIGYAYAHFPPGLVAPLLVCAMVLTNVGFTLAYLGGRISLPLLGAIGLMMAGGVWASILLQSARQAP